MKFNLIAIRSIFSKRLPGKSFKEIQRMLRSICWINAGGCGIAALAMFDAAIREKLRPKICYFYQSSNEKDLITNDPTKAGFLSYYVLWGDSTSFARNLAAYKKRFNL